MKKLSLIFIFSYLVSAHAYEVQIKKGEMAPDLETLLEKASMDTGVSFKSSHFQLIEERDLATSKFSMFVQMNSDVPVAKTAVRIWSDLVTNELILAEMHLDEETQKQEKHLANKYARAKFSQKAMKSQQLKNAISLLVTEEVLKHSTDPRIISMKSKDQWENGDLVREVEVKARRGVHMITISLLKNKIVRSTYHEFPQSEGILKKKPISKFFSLKANVFPIYEEVEGSGERLAYELKDLKYLRTLVRDAGENPLGTFSSMTFPESRYYPLLAGTALGDLNDLWSEASIRKKIEEMTVKLPLRLNTFSNGVLLEGKYATINLHPEVKNVFKDIEFDLKPTTHHMLAWANVDGAWEAKPEAGLSGKMISSQNDLLARIPFRHPEHKTTAYINSGFDEVQVYYAVTTLMESLAKMGFTDKELSEKPFHAFLFDPDIGMRNNAYYNDNTINFTTYTPENPNLARDNPTIWHELGHGVMDRLMGPHLVFAGAGGYGGLSEGMADFVASIIVEDQTDGVSFPGKADFRIINETGFYLTNEFHDEGEAYGGAMNDMLMEIISAEGREGLHSFTDLTLETMRLTRNHPALTAAGWFEHMLYADEMGSEVRASGKFQSIIKDALKSRNFSFDDNFVPASMKLSFDGKEVTDSSEASRNNPLKPCAKDGTVAYDLKLSLTEGDADFIKFPATVKVEYKKGALQGAVKWAGEVNNPEVYTVHSSEELLSLPVSASMECDYVNQPDGSCKDYAYVQVFNATSKKPIAKKRFYLQISQKNCK